MLDGFWITGSGGASASYTIPSPTGSGTTYYVSPDGNDLSAGTSAATAWATLTKAVATATTAGDVVIIRPGQYSATSSSPFLTFGASGSSGAPITFAAEVEGSVVVNGESVCSVGALINEVSYLDFYGIQFEGFTDRAVSSDATSTTQSTNVRFLYCHFVGNGRSMRDPALTTRYGAVIINENTKSWTFDECTFHKNGPLVNSDFDSESATYNASYRVGVGLRIAGCLHTVSNSHFADFESGYPISISGHWDHTTLSGGQYNVVVDTCYFEASTNQSPYSTTHGFIEIFDDATSHGSYSAVFPLVSVTGCTSEASVAGSGTNTFIGIWNDSASYGATSIAHSFTDNTVAATSLYNEGEAWLASHASIVATGNTTSATISDDTKKLAVVDATRGISPTYRGRRIVEWTPHNIPYAKQAFWFDGTDESTKTIETGVRDWYSKFYGEWYQSGAGYRVGSSSGANQPINQVGEYVTVSGTGQYITQSTNNPTGWYSASKTLVAVLYFPTGAGTSYPFQIYGNNIQPGFALLHVSGAIRGYGRDDAGGYGPPPYVSFPAVYDTKLLISLTHRVDTVTGEAWLSIAKNGAVQASAECEYDTDTAYTLRLFRNCTADTRIYDLAMILSESDDDRERLEGYFAWKHGLQASLPATHPYYSERPLTIERD